KRLASAHGDKVVLLWDTGGKHPPHRMTVTEEQADLAFSPDGKRLAGTSRNLVTVWDAATGQAMLTLHGAPQRPGDNGFNPPVAFSPDGKRLAALNWNGTISVWDGEEWGEARLAARRKAAEARAFAWHLDHARASRDAGLTYAAEFHLQRLKQLTAP